MPKGLAICVHRLGPYHHARIAAAANATSVVALEFSRKTDQYDWAEVDTSSRFARTTLCDDSRKLETPRLRSLVERQMDEIGPSVVAVNGWSDRAALLVLDWANRNQVPAICMSESTPWDFRRNAAKEFLKRQLVSGFSAGLVGAHQHAAYLARLGMNPTDVFLGYDAIDNSHFSPTNANDHCLDAQLQELKPYFLVAARFIPKKNLSRLLAAYATYVKSCQG